MLRNAVEGVKFTGKKQYESERFNVISVARGLVSNIIRMDHKG